MSVGCGGCGQLRARQMFLITFLAQALVAINKTGDVCPVRTVDSVDCTTIILIELLTCNCVN